LASQFDYARIVKTKELLEGSLRARKKVPGRISLQREGDRLDRRTGGEWVVEQLTKLDLDSKNAAFIVDSVRIAGQVNAIRRAFSSVSHVHLKAPVETLRRRYRENPQSEGKAPTYEEVQRNATERNVVTLADIADIVIDTKRCTPEDVFVRAKSLIPFFSSRTGYVDVVVGGQFGSEGKGRIVDYLSKDYDMIVRIGGPNAGHTVPEADGSHVYHMLPSGSKTNRLDLVLAPGMIVNIDDLWDEISECKVEASRLSIDPQVMTITRNDKVAETALKKLIGSTGKGVGSATARRIMGRGSRKVKLMGEIKRFKPFIRKTIDVLSKALTENKRILIEGTQGTGLSLYHGDYPYVTSRDTTASGCLSEAGIPPLRVRRVIMVCRTLPIRVKNPKGRTSGKLSQELTWEEVSQRSSVPVEVLKEREKGSTSGRLRRIAEFDWKLLERSRFLNGPTDIALTFADYLSQKNAGKFRLDQLDPSTIEFIEEVERVACAPVSLITTGPEKRHIIDRRSW
jgi:adenylosuccinate synthase